MYYIGLEVNLTARFYGNAVYPSGGSSWSMRLQIALLFPKLTKEQEKPGEKAEAT
jgi:hypothetical protein